MMTREERQKLAKKIIRSTEDQIDDEHFIHRLLAESTLYNIYENEKATFGQKAADLMARFAGSWAFVIIFCTALILWVGINFILTDRAFDPFPFILLNLILSCVSALQAPFIMMSQNRQEEKDRKRSEGDYKINLKSEIIIEDVHYKLDSIIKRQNQILQLLEENDKDK